MAVPGKNTEKRSAIQAVGRRSCQQVEIPEYIRRRAKLSAGYFSPGSL